MIKEISLGMSVSTRGLEKGLKRAESHVQSFAGAATSLKGVLVGLAGAMALREVGRAVVGGIGSAVKSASALNEQVSKSRTVFGDAAGVIEKEAQRMADAFGYPKVQFFEGASAIGLIAKGAGLAQGAAAKMGASFATLAADAASFHDVPVDIALDKIRAGLTGESEPLRAFGVLLNEDAVKTEALRLGLARMGEKLGESAKFQARASLITKGLADAQGDLARTATSAANQMRAVWGRLENTMADVGAAIQPVTDAVLTLANTAVARLGEAVIANREAVFAWAKEAADGGNVVFTAFELAGKGLAVVLDVVDELSLGFKLDQLGVVTLQAAIAELNLAVNEAGLAWERFWGIRNAETERGVAAAQDAVFNAVEKMAEMEQALNDALVAPSNREKITGVFDEIKAKAAEALRPVVSLGDATKGLAQALAAVPGAGIGGLVGGAMAGMDPRGLAAPSSPAAAKITAQMDELRREIATFGKTSTFETVAKLKEAGATDRDVGGVATLSRHLEGLKLKQETMKPAEILEKRMKELDELRSSRSVDFETYKRGVQGARKDYFGAVESPHANAAAVMQGSQEAYAAQVRSVQGVRIEEPIKDVAETNRKQVDLQTKMVTALNRVVSQATGAPFSVVPFPGS